MKLSELFKRNMAISCQQCGATIHHYNKPTIVNTHVFCSHECQEEDQEDNQVSVTCEQLELELS